MGRPSRLTPDVQELLVQAMRAGAAKTSAAKFAGISHQTILNWQDRANQGEPEYVALFDELEKAEGAFVIRALAQIADAARKGQWTAAAWTLERRYPEEYGRRLVEQKHTGTITHAHAWIERLQQSFDETMPKQLETSHNGTTGDILDLEADE